MNHNQLDFEIDFINNLKDFLRRHTAFKSDEYYEFTHHNIFDVPLKIKEIIREMKMAPQTITFNCFTAENINNHVIESRDKNTEI